MNVTCDKCSKRYSIADEKVRGKSVKIRCKQCQNLISVQGPAGMPTEAGSAVSAVSVMMPQATSQPPAGSMVAQAAREEWEDERTRAMPSLDLSAAWYAMVKGTQLGPFDLAGLEKKVKSGEVTLRTYLWKQGMADWKRASDVPDVSPVFAGVSVQSTAASSTSLPPAKLPSKAVAAVQRDVAVAPQEPAPELLNQNGAANGHFGQDVQAEQPQPEAQAQPQGGGLSDLFNDTGGGTDENAAHQGDPDHEGTHADGGAGARAASEGAGAHDPFAALGEADPSQAPPPGEATKFFIAQAGVNKRNPPWKIALFVLSFIGLPVGILYLLSSLNVVPLKVTRTDENGQEVQQSFFSAEGITGLKDLLTGEEKRRREQAEAKKRAAAEAKKKAEVAVQPGTEGTPSGTTPGTTAANPGTPKNTNTPGLADFYAENTGGSKGPKNRLEGQAGSEGKQVVVSSKWSEAASKIVADKVKSFQSCIEEELRKNPNLKVGKVVVQATVSSSGTVTGAAIEPAKHNTSGWGECMKRSARRVVFPPLEEEGETVVEIPITVGVAVGD